jgi:hypothetical protein
MLTWVLVLRGCCLSSLEQANHEEMPISSCLDRVRYRFTMSEKRRVSSISGIANSLGREVRSFRPFFTSGQRHRGAVYVSEDLDETFVLLGAATARL